MPQILRFLEEHDVENLNVSLIFHVFLTLTLTKPLNPPRILMKKRNSLYATLSGTQPSPTTRATCNNGGARLFPV